MKESILKRCPCCGGEAIITQVTMLYNSPGDVKERITCTCCGLTMEDSFGLAKDKWNARVQNSTEIKSEDNKHDCDRCVFIKVCDKLKLKTDDEHCKNFKTDEMLLNVPINEVEAK